MESGGHQYISTRYTYADESLAKVVIDTSFNSWTNAIHGGFSVGNYSGPRVGVDSNGKFYYSFNNGVSYDVFYGYTKTGLIPKIIERMYNLYQSRMSVHE